MIRERMRERCLTAERRPTSGHVAATVRTRSHGVSRGQVVDDRRLMRPLLAGRDRRQLRLGSHEGTSLPTDDDRREPIGIGAPHDDQIQGHVHLSLLLR